MRELIIEVTIIGGFYYIISLILEFKVKNFIFEKHNILLILIMMVSLYLFGFFRYNNEQSISYTMFINVILAIAILGGYIIFQRNRIYFFKRIDKKLIVENTSEIKQIIEDYKSKYTDGKSDITLANNKVVFENVNKSRTEACLSLIGDYLDKNRKKYTSRDYLMYFIKFHLLPIVIMIAVLFIFFKLIAGR